MNKHIRISILLLITLLLSACGKQAPSSPDQEKDKTAKPRIALVMKSLANEFFLTMENGAKEHHAADPDRYELLADGIKDELDVNRQIQLVEQMMSRNVDAIVIAPADSKALIAVCQRAMAAGIVVINIDNKFDADVLAERGLHIPFVGPDNRKGARLAGEYLAKKLQAGDPVAIIEGVPSAFNGIQRLEGFRDAMEAAGMNIVASQVGDWEMAKANQVTAALLTEQPTLKGLLCANDNMALGALAALRSAGKLGSIYVVGFDAISAALELVEKGDLLATVEQHADQLAAYGIETALQLIETEGTPEDQETPVELVTAETLVN
ncbi:MAG: sugar ABC transporter substrate-binding protein [Candidatus Hydrogenedentes bacterium]|nr:sugar ABC transporter substrate-binding protein [Candidatus Hydrogenedentota bacterium]